MDYVLETSIYDEDEEEQEQEPSGATLGTQKTGTRKKTTPSSATRSQSNLMKKMKKWCYSSGRRGGLYQTKSITP